MNKNKIINKLIYCCFYLFVTSTLSGCLNSSPNTKEQKVIKIQKKRIQLLARQLKKKNRQLNKLKAKTWVSRKSHATADLRKVKRSFDQGKLVEALRSTSKLKKRYPRSKELRKLRVMIFQKMGLKRQAQNEALLLKKMVSQKKRGNRRRM